MQKKMGEHGSKMGESEEQNSRFIKNKKLRQEKKLKARRLDTLIIMKVAPSLVLLFSYIVVLDY